MAPFIGKVVEKMRETKQFLKRRISILEDELKVCREASVGTAKLGKCKSNMCHDCVHAVISHGSFGTRLIGCAKDSLCGDYVSLRAGNYDCSDRCD